MSPVLAVVIAALVLAAPTARAPRARPARDRAPAAVAHPMPRIPATLDSLLMGESPDSLVAPLRRFESARAGSADAAEAALVLGHLHFARSEYTQAAAAYSRAAARLDPARKPEARYWTGLAWLGMREPNQARAALEEVAASNSPRRTEAMLGIAIAWEMTGRNERALEELGRLLEGDPGEAGPAALERTIAIAEALHRPEVARSARVRLLRVYPRSIEAAMLSAPGVAGASAAKRIELLSGPYDSATRARALVSTARRAGFTDAEVVEPRAQSPKSYRVRLGSYPDAAAARAAGARATEKLGVPWTMGPAE